METFRYSAQAVHIPVEGEYGPAFKFTVEIEAAKEADAVKQFLQFTREFKSHAICYASELLGKL